MKPVILPPRQPSLIPWILKHCAACANASYPPRSKCDLAGCPHLASIAFAIFVQCPILPKTLDLIDPYWQDKFDRENPGWRLQTMPPRYKLPDNCDQWNPIC